ncbi:hypothetical protein D3C84_1019180 [compost metagenome]
MFLLLLEEALWNEHREVSVAVSRFLEPAVKIALNVFPQLIAFRTEYDAAANWGVIHQFRFLNDIDIPAGKIFALRRNFRYKTFLLRHKRSYCSPLNNRKISL